MKCIKEFIIRKINKSHLDLYRFKFDKEYQEEIVNKYFPYFSDFDIDINIMQRDNKCYHIILKKKLNDTLIIDNTKYTFGYPIKEYINLIEFSEFMEDVYREMCFLIYNQNDRIRKSKRISEDNKRLFSDFHKAFKKRLSN